MNISSLPAKLTQQTFLCRNYSKIFYLDLSLVYTITRALNIRETIHHIKKRMKTHAGLMWLRNGKTMIQKVAPSEFIIVENGMILGSTI